VSSPDVTVVIPVFNGAAWVADAIRSVQAQRIACEIIVVDDGSTDETPSVLGSFSDEIVMVRQLNRGLSAARNAGILRATAELLLFLDADDLQPPGYLEAFIGAASAAPQAEVFHCAYRAIDLVDGHDLYSEDTPKPLDADPVHELFAMGSPHIGALCLRRSAIDRVGLFDETLRLQEDWDYWLRLALSGARFRAVDAPPFIIRRRPNSLSRSAGSSLAFTGLAVAERHFAAHLPCPLCPDSRRLEQWRQAALLTSAVLIAARLPVSGRPARWAGMGLTVLRAPRLAPAAYRRLRGRRRRRRQP
jgi:glycosyltransferase involved in cell wall biosynthesis